MAVEYFFSLDVADASLLAAALVTCYLSYYILLHPLNHYRGPFLAKFTDAYAGYHGYRKTVHTETLRNWEKYGDVFRQGPNKLIFNSAAAVPDILLNPRLVKGDSHNHTRLTTKTHNIVNCTDKDMHKRKRHIIAPVLSEASMNRFNLKMTNRINQFLQVLLASSKAATPANMSELTMRLAFDVVGDLSFGFSFNTLTEDTYRFLPEVLLEIAWRVNNAMYMPSLRLYHLAMIALHPANMVEMKTAVMTFVGARKKQDTHAIHDFYSVAAGEIGEKSEFFLGEMWSESMAFLTAGGQTIPVALSNMFFYLSRYPDCYAKLAEEIRTTFASADEIRPGPKLSGCKYLKACFDEAMRCNSPLTNILWRSQDPADDSGEPFVVAGHEIPKGVEVGINLWALFHNDDIFPDPYTFNPERWFEKEGESEEDKADREEMRKAFVPFSAGQRVCAGKAMAWREMNLAIAKTFWFFDFEAAPGSAGELGEVFRTSFATLKHVPVFKMADAFIGEHDGPNLVFRPRTEVIGDLGVE